MSDLTKRLCRPGYDLQKEQAIQEAIIEIRKLRAELAEKNAAIIQINNICLRVEQECDAELSEQFRLLDMSAEREAKHLAQIDALEKERDALKDKIERMEKQEPVGVDARNAA